MIAVPDFSAGAMENWGLVVYRASMMLFEDGKPRSTRNKESGTWWGTNSRTSGSATW